MKSNYQNTMVYLDPGHGYIDPEGKYLSPHKMYTHKSGQFHIGPTFLEGAFNRSITHFMAGMLARYGVPYMILPEAYFDTALSVRVNVANKHYAQKEIMRGLYISNHANASPTHTATGWEVYTSPGNTEADEFANILVQEIEPIVGFTISKIRADLYTDGDPDKEAPFFVLKNTVMPAVLIEWGFFDHEKEARFLIDPEICFEYAAHAVTAIIKYFDGE